MESVPVETQELTPEQIVALKTELKDDFGLLPEVCTHIVMEMLLEAEETAQQMREEVESRGGSFMTNIHYETREDFAQHVSLLSAAWAASLQTAISLPGSEWPEGMTPPVTFSNAIVEIQSSKQNQRMADDVAGWLMDTFGFTVKADANGFEVTTRLEDLEEGEVFTMLHMAEENDSEPGTFSLTEFGDMVISAYQKRFI